MRPRSTALTMILLALLFPGVQTLHRGFQIEQQIRKLPRQRLGARDHHVIMTRRGVTFEHLPRRRLETAPRPVALDRDAHLAAGGEAHARRRGLRRHAAAGLQDQAGSDIFAPLAGNGQKIGSPLEALNLDHDSAAWAPHRCSSRKALATLGATAGNHAATPDRGHTRAKAVAALANEVAGLIGALHGWGLRRCFSLDGRRCIRKRVGEVNAAALPAKVTKALRRKALGTPGALG